MANWSADEALPAILSRQRTPDPHRRRLLALPLPILSNATTGFMTIGSRLRRNTGNWTLGRRRSGSATEPAATAARTAMRQRSGSCWAGSRRPGSVSPRPLIATGWPTDHRRPRRRYGPTPMPCGRPRASKHPRTLEPNGPRLRQRSRMTLDVICVAECDGLQRESTCLPAVSITLISLSVMSIELSRSIWQSLVRSRCARRAGTRATGVPKRSCTSSLAGN